MDDLSQRKQANLRLKREREQRGWSQEKLADLIGTTQKIVSRWERGGSVPLPYYREKLCTLFGKDAVELGLLGESPEEERALTLTQRTAPDQTWPDPLLTSYLQRQRTRMFNTLAPGSTDLRVRDIVGKDGLFLSPPWERVQGSTPSTTLVEYIIDALLAGEKILLLGEAGQGKTTILKQIFSLLADRFLDEPAHSLPLPIYIPLRDLPTLAGSAVEALWASLARIFRFLLRSLLRWCANFTSSSCLMDLTRRPAS